MIVDAGEDAVELLEDFVYIQIGWWTMFSNFFSTVTFQRQLIPNIVYFYSIKEFYKHIYNNRDAQLVMKINELLPREYADVVAADKWNFTLPSGQETIKQQRILRANLPKIAIIESDGYYE